MLDWAMMTWLALGGELVLRLGLSVRVVMRRAPVPTVLSWLVVLLLLPGVGIPAYLLIGEVRLGSRRARRYRHVAADLAQRAHVFWRKGAQDWTSEVEPYRHVARLLTHLGEMPPLVGNHLELIADTRQFLAALVREIDRSDRWCHLLFYIWSDDATTRQVAEALVRAAKRGVQCRLLVDAAGSRRFLRSDTCARMRLAGVRVRASLDVSPFRALFQRIDIRNHRKIGAMDGKVAFVGSHNVTDPRYGHRPERGIGPWIDVSVRVTGPAAQALEVVFLHDWEVEGTEELAPFEERIGPPSRSTGSSIVQVVPSGPVPAPDAIHEALLTAIHAARREIIITTPYFVLDDATKLALICAVGHGVRVTVVVPARLDGRLVAAASRASYAELLEAGVRILEHGPGLLHAKTLTIDTDLALIGSANMDIRSLRLNFEATLFVFDDDFASHLRMLQMEYAGQSRELFAAEWRKRPVWWRFKEGVARLAGPLL